MKNTYRPRKLLTATELAEQATAGAALVARTAQLRVQIATERGNALDAYKPSVIAAAKRQAKADLQTCFLCADTCGCAS